MSDHLVQAFLLARAIPVVTWSARGLSIMKGGSAMSRQSCQSFAVEGSDTYDRLRPSDEVLETCPHGDTIRRIPDRRRPLRVLVADDCTDAADSLSMLLRMWGHDVRLTYDGEAAIEMACVYQPDVLLLDIAMPKLDGCRLAQRLRRQARFMDTLLVAITGYGDEAHRLLCEAAGFDVFLIKPIDPATLETLLLLELDRLLGPPKARLATPDQLAGDRAGPCSGHRARASARQDGTPVNATV